MKFVVNSAIVAALLSSITNVGVDARLNMPWARELQASDLQITVFEEQKLITAEQTEYDQNQNHADNYVAVSGSTASLSGNLWRSFELPEGVDVATDTVLSFDFTLDAAGSDFVAICVDENEVLGDGKRCFVVAAKEGEWITDMYNIPNMAVVGTPKTFEIPIGLYFTGTVNHLALVQDNDSDTPSAGSSTFSNIAFTKDEVQKFHFTLNGADVEIPDNQLSYAGSQDTKQHVMQISSDDPTSITLIGNSWKAYELPTPLQFNESTTVEFDFGATDEPEEGAICFDNNLQNDGKRCFRISGKHGPPGDMYKTLLKTSGGEKNHYKIPVGHFFTGEIAYLAFVQDNDSPKTYGLSTYSDIKIYDEDRADLKIEVDGSMVTVPNSQNQYHGSEDTREHVLEISDDGLSATMEGNIFRSIALETPVEITRASQLEFDVELKNSSHVKFLGFGLDNDLSFSSSSRSIFQLYGSKSNAITYPEDITEGETKHYSLPVGVDVTNNMTYVSFVQENDISDVLRKTGESTISNIKIYERPDIMLKYGDVDTPVFNDQIQYDGTRQDNDKRNIWDVSADGLSITMRDNNWKAVEVPPYMIEEDTVLAFDFTLAEETEFHAICLEDDLAHHRSTKSCFKVSGTQTVNDMFTLPDQTKPSTTSPTVTKTYAIRVGHFLAGREVKYFGFVQDNDSGDRKGGESTYSNIQLFDAATCLLDDTSFNFSLDECTIDDITAGLETQLGSSSCSKNVLSELFGYFTEANFLYEIEKALGDICTTGYEMVSPLAFEQLSSDGYQFIEGFFDGDNKWIYENDALDDGIYSHELAKEAGMIEVLNGKMASEGIALPEVHNFKNCELHAAMCCWVAERKTAVDAEPVDNSDVCYVDFTRAKRSSHVKDGYSIYNGDNVEGAVNCHGFAWGNEHGYADSALAGNTLFNVAMYQGLYQAGYVEEVPGAPMCGCVEQMPVVTKADCTKINVDKTVDLKYDHTKTAFIAEVTINSIAHESCEDLSSYYNELVTQGKATDDEKAKLGEILVGEGGCPSAISDFLGTKGLAIA